MAAGPLMQEQNYRASKGVEFLFSWHSFLRVDNSVNCVSCCYFVGLCPIIVDFFNLIISVLFNNFIGLHGKIIFRNKFCQAFFSTIFRHVT